jgi:hypothetical protein
MPVPVGRPPAAGAKILLVGLRFLSDFLSSLPGSPSGIRTRPFESTSLSSRPQNPLVSLIPPLRAAPFRVALRKKALRPVHARLTARKHTLTLTTSHIRSGAPSARNPCPSPHATISQSSKSASAAASAPSSPAQDTYATVDMRVAPSPSANELSAALAPGQYRGAGVCRQLSLLLWKNWVIKKNKWVDTLIEIITPVIFALLLLAIRGAIKVEQIAESMF